METMICQFLFIKKLYWEDITKSNTRAVVSIERWLDYGIDGFKYSLSLPKTFKAIISILFNLSEYRFTTFFIFRKLYGIQKCKSGELSF